jgi:hypothetical protein
MNCALKHSIFLLAAATFVFGQDVERGKYLVEQVAKCQDCHTPRLASGEHDKANWLKGAELDFAPTHEIKTWHKKSPDITGSSALFKRWMDKGIIDFLVTGKNPRGGTADVPMPTYNLKQADAEAIVAYLKSLP